jgi:hypothetical protein
MNMFLMLVLGAFLAWWGWRLMRGNPGAFSWENFNRSMFVLGVLGLLLVLVVVVCVKLLAL